MDFVGHKCAGLGTYTDATKHAVFYHSLSSHGLPFVFSTERKLACLFPIAHSAQEPGTSVVEGEDPASNTRQCNPVLSTKHRPFEASSALTRPLSF